MNKYPERYWSEEDKEKIKKEYFGCGKKRTNCLAPNCDGIVEIKKETENLKSEYQKKGDFFLNLKCNKCQREDTLQIPGHFTK